MTSAFWDTSALVPLCTVQKGDVTARQLAKRHTLTVWWATPVEMQSALARLFRNASINSLELRQARARQERLRRGWNEIQPTEPLRTLAETLLDRYQLRAADSLQLAAAHTWAMHRPKGRIFIAGDKQLLEAAESAGFHTIEI